MKGWLRARLFRWYWRPAVYEDRAWYREPRRLAFLLRPLWAWSMAEVGEKEK